MKIVEKLTSVFKRTFCDEIVDIKPPCEHWVEYKDIGRRLEGYTMSVKYKYKGWREFLSGIDNDHFLIVSKETALENALGFYERNLAKINKKRSR